MLIELKETGAVCIYGEYVELWDLRKAIEKAMEKGVGRVPINFEGQIHPVTVRKTVS